MNNVFNKMQMLETSEVCNKFSKSVSYETLVIDATTIGREYVQNKWLSKGSADKPLTAVGTLTSLLCNSAKVKEKWLRHVITKRTLVRRGYLPEQGTHENKESLFANVTCFMRLPRRIQRMLLVMTISALALLFTIFTTAESWATDKIPTSGTCNTAGTCLWMLNDAGTLTIYAKDGAKDVKMANYNCDDSPCKTSTLDARPWEANLQQIKNVVIGDNITHIGDDAFQNASNLTSVTGMKDVKTIGESGVFAYTGLTEITIPDGVTYIGLGAFNSINMKNVTLPDTINKIGSNTNLFKVNKAEINCLNTKGQCEKLRTLLSNAIKGRNFNIIFPTSNCETYNSKGCTSCEKEYSLADGMCWAPWEKKHYTPAEANEWLKDDNNTITITFKK